MNRSIVFIVGLSAALLIIASPVLGGVGGKLTREMIEETLGKAANKSGRGFLDQRAKKSATETLERLVKTHGDDVLKVVDDAGIELLEAVPKYGDDVVEIAMKASPEARRAFAKNIPDMLPLARRVGIEAVELEAKSPGLATKVFQVFGDDAAKGIAKNVPKEDIPGLLRYAENADNNQTRELLLETYKKEGKTLFERIPPSLVLSSGLTAAMLYGTHRMTEPGRKLSDKIDKLDPSGAEKVINQLITSGTAWGAVVLLALIVLLLWRFGLMPWHRIKPDSTKSLHRETVQNNRSKIDEIKRDCSSEYKANATNEKKYSGKTDDQVIR